MTLNFDWLATYWQTIVLAVALTIKLTLIGGACGFGFGISVAWSNVYGPRALRLVMRAYIEVIRNTPFLTQLLFIFFGLPALGLRLSAQFAGIIALTVNTAAYMGEIIRGGLEATPQGQTEAAICLGMSHGEAFRHVILFPALQRVWPAIVGQFVLDMFATSVLSQIAVEELTWAASFIESRNFRAFETYILMASVYLVLSFLIRHTLIFVGQSVFDRSART